MNFCFYGCEVFLIRVSLINLIFRKRLLSFSVLKTEPSFAGIVMNPSIQLVAFQQITSGFWPLESEWL
jgi:hypothetical protein